MARPQRHSHVVYELLIVKVRRSVRTPRPHKSGDCVDDQAKFPLSGLQSNFSLLTIVDVSACSVPSNDLARIIAERLSTNEKPSINSVISTDTRLDLATF